MPGPNNRRMAERLGRQRDFIDRVRTDAEAADLIGRRGYSAEKIADGLALHEAAQTAYGGRDTSSGATGRAADALTAADAAARRRMADLRGTLVAMYTDGSDRTALGIARERLADDRDTFLTESRATLAAVRQAPYAVPVAEAGQTERDLDATADALAALSAAAGAYGQSDGGEEASTDARDAAYEAFQTWMTRFRRFVRLAVRDHPAVAARLGQ